MANALLTDLYELNMAASYLRRDMADRAVFSLFVRQLPPTRGFLVVAGIEDCLSYLEGFRFEPEEIDHLRVSLGFDDATLRAFEKLRFTGDVWAIPEGGIVFGNEPILEVEAPIAEAQLVETYLLNQITFQTAVASKAARCRIAARGRDLVDFSFRRTHGIDAAMSVARASAIAGFVATSNVEAARRFGLKLSGTMAHSYVEAFATEVEAFRAFAEDFPGRTTFLVDTYDTMDGVRAAITVAHELGTAPQIGVRLDSGDLAVEAREARALLDAAGLRGARIFASGGLDEHDVDALVSVGAPIDAFGIGTKLGVSADAPALDSVYKLVAYAGRPVLKLSSGKVTAPGTKQVFRHPWFEGDVIGLRSEQGPAGLEPLLVPVMREGRHVAAAEPLAAAQARFDAALARLPEPARQLRSPQVQAVAWSAALAELTDDLTRRIRGGVSADQVRAGRPAPRRSDDEKRAPGDEGERRPRT